MIVEHFSLFDAWSTSITQQPGVIAGIIVIAAVIVIITLWALVFAHRTRLFEQIIGSIGELQEPVAKGQSAWALIQGERWRVYCKTNLPAGASIRVIERKGLKLWVEPANSHS